MNLGAFGLVILLESKGYAGESVDDFNGLAGKNPWLAAAMLVFLLSLAGIPPTAGFVGKYFLFSAAMKAGWFWLALLAVLMSAVSLFYYFRIARAMYLVDGEGDAPLARGACRVRGDRALRGGDARDGHPARTVRSVRPDVSPAVRAVSDDEPRGGRDSRRFLGDVLTFGWVLPAAIAAGAGLGYLADRLLGIFPVLTAYLRRSRLRRGPPADLP